MGLFISGDHDPEVYKNEEELIARNQPRFRQDELVDMIRAQQQASTELQETVHSLKAAYTKQSSAQFRKLANARYHIETLYDGQKQQQEHFGTVSQSTTEMDEKLLALSTKIEAQMTFQEELKEALEKQESFQKEVLQRLKDQEALAEKILRKVDHFRTILYERTHFISEKIGKGYEATTAYFAKMMKQEPVKEEIEEVKEREESIS